MPAKCCVVGCNMRREKNEIKFFKFPQIQNKSVNLNELSKERQKCWLKAINRKNITKSMLKNWHVCSKHFISGTSANIKDKLNPDWVPTLNLGYTNNKVLKQSLATNSINRYQRIVKKRETAVANNAGPESSSSTLNEIEEDINMVIYEEKSCQTESN